MSIQWIRAWGLHHVMCMHEFARGPRCGDSTQLGRGGVWRFLVRVTWEHHVVSPIHHPGPRLMPVNAMEKSGSPPPEFESVGRAGERERERESE